MPEDDLQILTPTPEPPTFQQLVLRGLMRKGVTTACPACFIDANWDGWLPPPEPGYEYGVSGNALLVARVICRGCGCVRTFSLSALGIRTEESRVLDVDASNIII